MSRMQRYHNFLLLSVLPLISAQISLQDVQAIVGFPDSCMSAYSTSLSSCTADMFRGNGGSSQCSQDCFNQLSDVTSTIQSACAGQKASGGSLIGHFFVGDANTFLCGFDTGSGTDTTTAAATTTTSVIETTATSTSTTEVSSTTEVLSTTEVSSTTTEESSSSSTSSTKTQTAETTSTSTKKKVTTTTLQPSTTSTESSSRSSSSSTSAVATAGQSNSQIGITGGGSPFDITLPAAAPSVHGSLRMSVLLGLVTATVMVGG